MQDLRLLHLFLQQPVDVKPRRQSKPVRAMAGDSVPFWKREIGLRGKPKPRVEPVLAEERRRTAKPVPGGGDSKGVPFWKREISLRRKPRVEAVLADERREAAKPKPVPAAVGDSNGVPFWKREISLRRKPKPRVEAVLSEEPEPMVEAVREPEQAKQPDRAVVPVPVAEPVEPVDAVDPVEPVAEAPVAEPVEPARPTGDEPVTEALTEPLAEATEPVATETDTDQELEAPSPPATPERRTSRRRHTRRRAKEVEPKAAEPKATEPASPAPAVNGRALRRSRGAKQIVGLRIGSSQLAAACVSNNGSPELVQVAREPLQPGVVVGGELRDPDALATALAAFFKKHKLPRKGVRLGIASNRIGVRSFDIAGIDDPAQLANAVRFRAQDALPIPLNEAALDYQVLDESVNEEGERTHHILLVVAYKDLVDGYAAACRKAGLKLIGVDLEAFALLRALAAPRVHDTASAGALVAVSVGNDSSILAVSDGRVCEFTRLLDWGGANLDAAIAKTLDITPAEAEPIKRRLAEAAPEVVIEGVTPELSKKLRAAILEELHGFARELVSSLAFYQNQPGSLEIGDIVLTGGGSNFTGLAAQLERSSGVTVRVGDPLGRVKVGKRVERPESVGSLAVAIGLGIED